MEATGLKILFIFVSNTFLSSACRSYGKAAQVDLNKNMLTNPHNDKGSHTIEYAQVLDPKNDVVQEQSHQTAQSNTGDAKE